jgi:hypothetical protein
VDQPLQHPADEGGIGALTGQAQDTGNPAHGDSFE